MWGYSGGFNFVDFGNFFFFFFDEWYSVHRFLFFVFPDANTATH